MIRWIYNYPVPATILLAFLFLFQQWLVRQLCEGYGVLFSGVYIGLLVLIGWRLTVYKLARMR